MQFCLKIGILHRKKIFQHYFPTFLQHVKMKSILNFKAETPSSMNFFMSFPSGLHWCNISARSYAAWEAKCLLNHVLLWQRFKRPLRSLFRPLCTVSFGSHACDCGVDLIFRVLILTQLKKSSKHLHPLRQIPRSRRITHPPSPCFLSKSEPGA